MIADLRRIDSPRFLPEIPCAMPDLVTIASNLDLQEACLARARLEGSGIYCFLANEALMRTCYPRFSFGVRGMELRVMRRDAPAAIEVLTDRKFDAACEPDAFPAMARSCPQCKHARVTRKRCGWRSGLLLGVVLTLCGVPLPLWRDRKICRNCGHKWK
jgi:hypothetical protein